ncbi:MAG TPA: HEAT repeat domain-containing protein, partial [Actinomycetota bacterium]
DPDPFVRRIALEIVAELPDPVATGLPLVERLRDEDPGVRLAALRAVARSNDGGAREAALTLLDDLDPEIRAAAADAVPADPGQGGVAESLHAHLADPNVAARVRIAAALLRLGQDGGARTALVAAARTSIPEGRAAAMVALGELRMEADLVTAGLGDKDPSVRAAAARALPTFGPPASTEQLLAALADEDPTVRDAVSDAIASLGPDVAGRVAAYLADPRREATALSVLVRLPNADPQVLRSYARHEQTRAVHFHRLWQQLSPHDDERVKLLVAGLRHRALRHGEHAVHALAPFGDHAGADLAIQDLTSRDPNQRANAVETLEALSDSEVVRPLLSIWEPLPATHPADGAVLRSVLEEDDPWIRACAAYAAAAFPDSGLQGAVQELADRDPDATVRQAAGQTVREDMRMETLPKLSLMDRMVALQQVPLFRELSPADLKLVAESLTENAYADGTVIAEQGEPGEAMHVVVSGEVRVLVGDEATEVARRGPGYIVGEMAVLAEQPRMANLVAVGELRTLSIDRRRFRRILRDRPDAALAVVRELCARLQDASSGRGPNPAP